MTDGVFKKICSRSREMYFLAGKRVSNRAAMDIIKTGNHVLLTEHIAHNNTVQREDGNG